MDTKKRRSYLSTESNDSANSDDSPLLSSSGAAIRDDRSEMIDQAAGGRVSNSNRIKKCLKNSFSSQFPPSIKYIVGCELSERYCYYGMRAILVFYFTNYFLLDKDRATAMYHLYIMFTYFTPLLGGIISDTFWGKYKTILLLSLVYCAGNIVVSVTSIPYLTGEPPHWWGAFLGLALISLGAGGIKPCVASFGGDQFKPEEESSRQKFFSLFYFCINLGSFLSMIITPKLRGDVQCFDLDECFPLAFAIPASLMLIATIVFVIGSHTYVRVPPQGNLLGDVVKSIFTALRVKSQNRKRGILNVKAHWMDYASDKFSVEFIEDVKAMLRVLIIFVPLPIFWTLYDQQGSRWTLQAQQMSGDLGTLGSIEPDQMQSINAVLILLLIPFFDKVVYPLCAKLRLKLTPLRKMGFGMLLVAFAFVISALVQISIEKQQFSVSFQNSQHAKLSIYNLDSRKLEMIMTQVQDESSMQSVLSLQKSLLPGQFLPYVDVQAGYSNLSLAYTSSLYCNIESGKISSCDSSSSSNSVNGIVDVKSESLLSLFALPFFNSTLNETLLSFIFQMDNFIEIPPDSGAAAIRFMNAAGNSFTSGEDSAGSVSLHLTKGPSVSDLLLFPSVDQGALTDFLQCPMGSYTIEARLVSDNSLIATLPDFMLGDGEVVTFSISSQENVLTLQSFISVEAKEISMLWQIPQYVVLTAGEVMFSVTGLEFAYSQAPESMKAVATAAWYLTVAFGNIVVVIVSESKLFESQIAEFFFYAGLLTAVILLFIWIALKFRYADAFTSSSNKAFAAGSSSSSDNAEDADKTALESHSSKRSKSRSMRRNKNKKQSDDGGDAIELSKGNTRSQSYTSDKKRVEESAGGSELSENDDDDYDDDDDDDDTLNILRTSSKSISRTLESDTHIFGSSKSSRKPHLYIEDARTSTTTF